MNREDYKSLIQKLLPRGPAWSKEKKSTMASLCDGISGLFWYVQQRCDAILKEANPATTNEMLSDWEEMCGLPEDCVHGGHTSGQTFEDRRNAVLNKVTQQISPILPDYEKQAERLGYEIELTEFRPLVCGIARCGDRLGGGPSARFYLNILIRGSNLRYARCGLVRCGELLGRITYATELECLFNRIKPAHIILNFSYEGE